MVAAAEDDHGGPVRCTFQLADHLLDLRVRPGGVVHAGNLRRFLASVRGSVGVRVFFVLGSFRVRLRGSGGVDDPSFLVDLHAEGTERTAEVVLLPPFLPREGCVCV